MRPLWLELRLFFAERATWVLLLLFGAALAYGLANGASVGNSARTSAQAIELETQQWYSEVCAALERQSIDPRQVAARPTLALLPPAPLPALAVGQSDLLPAHEAVSLFRMGVPSDGRAGLENPARLMAGRFDLAFVLVWLLPLFLLACAYDLCAGDREAGTLRMVLAQGTAPWRWIGQRALVRSAPVLALACGATLLAGRIGAQGGLESRVLLALAVVLAYGLFWVAVAVLVNGFARSAAEAATAVGALWVVFVLVLPTLLNIVVESLHPSPARSELVAEARAAAAEAEQRGNELVSSLYRDHPELAPRGMQADMLSRMLAVQDEVGRAMDPVKQRFAHAILEQQRVVDLWRFVSPAISVHEALSDLAGTGYWRHRAFQEQVATFEGTLHAFYSPKFHKRQPLTKLDIPEFPRFDFQEEHPTRWQARVWASLLGILSLTACAALAAAQRLSPRRLAA